MASLYDLIYDFFFKHIFNSTGQVSMTYYLEDLQWKINSEGTLVNLQDWLCITCSVISIIFIVVLCCLFVYKIIKLIGGLIR